MIRVKFFLFSKNLITILRVKKYRLIPFYIPIL